MTVNVNELDEVHIDIILETVCENFRDKSRSLDDKRKIARELVYAVNDLDFDGLFGEDGWKFTQF